LISASLSLILQKLLPPLQQMMPIAGLPLPKVRLFPEVTIQERTKRKCKSGSDLALSRQVPGTSSPRIS
jgi:hypothetical protein